MSETSQVQHARELRKHRRVFFAFPVTFTIGDITFEGQCQRIANIGMHIFTTEVAEPGPLWGEVSFALPGTGKLLVVPGRVLRSTVEDHKSGVLGGMLIMFGDLSREDQESIRDFVGLCIARSEEFGDMTQTEVCESSIPVRFFATDTPANQYVVNISEGGAFVRTLKPEPVTSIVNVDLYLPGSDAVSCIKAQVAWTREPEAGSANSGMGLKFLDIPKDVEASLTAFVDKYGVDVG
jgi:uncharacterized protein (TIGR02266 family)